MKKRLQYNILLASLVLFSGSGLLSCKKYLEAIPSDNLTVASTLKDVQGLLDFSLGMNFRAPSFGETSATDYFVTQASFDRFIISHQDAYTWGNPVYNFSNDWALIYTVVNICNTSIETLNKIERNSTVNSTWSNLYGSALVYRSNSFLKAVWNYSKAFDANTAADDLGIVLRTSSDINVLSVRSSVKETYEKIIGDLKEAVPLLPIGQELSTRPSRLTAYGLLARAYLSMRIYDSAFKYADLCLQSKSVLLDFNTDITITTGSATPFTPFNKEVIFTTGIGTYSFASLTPTYSRIDTTLYRSYQANDLRKTAFFCQQPDGQQFKGTYMRSRTQFFTGITTAEMFMVRAECYARKEMVTEAMNDLNTLLVKRWRTGFFTSFSATNPTDALAVILVERRKELLMRDLRWIDIKRLNKEGMNIVLTRRVNNQTYTLPPNDNRYALPLPADIIAQSGMPQNPY